MLIVKKFGGSSLSSAEKLRHAAELCAAEWKKGNATAVVVSARGDTTDELEAAAGEINAHIPPRERDMLLVTGEMQSAALMAAQLAAFDIPAVSLTGAQAGIITDSCHGCAEIRTVDTNRLSALLKAGYLPVICGFQGADERGELTTLGRGGSDTSAAALAAALKAERCEIYTDVDGIYTADPRLIPSAQRLESIDFASMLTLAENGAQVLHPRAVKTAMEGGIRLIVLPALGDGNGTELKFAPAPPFAGIAVSDSAVTAVGTAANAENCEKVLSLISDRGTVIKSAACTDDCIKITVSREKLPDTAEIIHNYFLSV